MATSRLCQRTLSAFKSSNRLWEPVHSFSLMTQNLDAISSRPVERAKLLLDGILKDSKRPDIIFLQEVTSDVRTLILSTPKVREAFLVTDAEDQTSFEGVPFANMTLLSSKRFAFNLESQKEDDGVERGKKFMLGPVSRIKLPSKCRRCALSVDIITPPTLSTPSTTCRLINVHLDSLDKTLDNTLRYRIKQMEILANLLHKPGCGGLIAGDFNAMTFDDHALPEINGLEDAWIELHGKKVLNGNTWGVDVKRPAGLRPGRLDKVATLGIEVKDMEILRPGWIEVPKPGGNSDHIPCSDHFGLRVSFTV